MGDTNDAGNGGTGNEGKEFKAPASQEEFDRMVSDRLTRERAKFADYDALKEKAAKFDEADAANKTELQKAIERAETAERERDKERSESLRSAVALAKGLTASQAKRLVGTTREELEADADVLLADLKPQTKPATDPKKLKSGSGGAGDTGGSRAAAALRQLRGAN